MSILTPKIQEPFHQTHKPPAKKQNIKNKKICSFLLYALPVHPIQRPDFEFYQKIWDWTDLDIFASNSSASCRPNREVGCRLKRRRPWFPSTRVCRVGRKFVCGLWGCFGSFKFLWVYYLFEALLHSWVKPFSWSFSVLVCLLFCVKNINQMNCLFVYLEWFVYMGIVIQGIKKKLVNPSNNLLLFVKIKNV